MLPIGIGIDLGTTYSCVAVLQNDRVKIIPNDQGNLKTPSYVSFSDTGLLVGEAAKSQLARNPANTVFNAMRLIGRRFEDLEVQLGINHFPFKVENKNGKPVIKVEYRGETKTLTPEEIMSMVLFKMKKTAESYLGGTVSNAVITIPSHFNHFQRAAINDACTISGLNVLYILSESTAAAIGYAIDKQIQSERNVLIFDLGGGSLSVSLVTIEEGIIEVKATAGDTHLGGEDFDNCLVDYCVQEFRRKNKKDLTSDPRALCRLRAACERAKCGLSSSTQISIEIDSLFEGIDFYISLTRARFKELCHDLFRTILEPVERVFRDSKIDKSEVEDIILVGSSTRIPCIVELVSNFFEGKAPSRSINPEEAIVYGAAIQAAILSGDASGKLSETLLLDVAPFSTGIETGDGKFTPIIKRNTTVPTKNSKIISTDFDNQTSKTIQVYEGESTRTKGNNFLGDFELTGIPVAPRGVPQIEVTFVIDAKGTLIVSAQNKTGETSGHLEISYNKIGLPREEIKRIISEFEKYKEDEGATTSGTTASEETLESYVHSLRSILQDDNLTNKLEAVDKFKLEYAVNETSSWLDASRKEYKRKQKELEALAGPILSRLHH